MSAKDRIDDILADKKLVSTSDENAKHGAEALKALKEETIDALSDKQISTFLNRQTGAENAKNAAKLIEDNFTPEELEKLSDSIYSTFFIQQMCIYADSANKAKALKFFAKELKSL